MKRQHWASGFAVILSLALSACSQPTATPLAVTPTQASPATLVLPQPATPPGGYPAVTPVSTPTADAYPALSTVTPAPALEATATLTPTLTATPDPTNTPAPTGTATPVNIVYRNFAVEPSPITIQAGTRVDFLIRDSVHQPYAGQAAPWVFEAPANLEPGASWSYTFSQPGTFTILCGFHPNMSGTVIVQP
jgi:plastocyanin